MLKNLHWKTLLVQYVLALWVVGGLDAFTWFDWRSLFWAAVLSGLLLLHGAFWRWVLPPRLYPLGLTFGFSVIFPLMLVLHCWVWYDWLYPIKISPATTFITEPRTSDGKRVDMFLALEQRITPKQLLDRPQENGFRLMVERFGPTFALDCFYSNFKYAQTDWEQIREKLQLDPNTDWRAEPKHVFRHFRIMLEEREEERNPEPNRGSDEEGYQKWNKWREESERNIDEIHQPAMEAWERPWTAEEFPELAQWIEESNIFFDSLGEAVRMPVYFVPFYRENENEYLQRSLDQYSQARFIARELTIRVHYHLGRGDIEKAWYDTMTQFRLWKQESNFSYHPAHVFALYSRIAPLNVLQHGNLSLEQIREFRAEIEPFLTPLDEHILENHKFGVHIDTLDYCLRGTYSESWSGLKRTNGIFAWNQALAKLNRGFDAAWNESLQNAARPHDFSGEDPHEHLEDPGRAFIAKTLLWYGPCKWFPGIMTDAVLRYTNPADVFLCCPSPLQGYDTRGQAMQKTMVRLGFALAEHKAEHGEFPETLEKLATPTILDPFSQNQPFHYERNEDGSCRFYSVGSNGVDDHGLKDYENNADDIAVIWQP